MEYVNDFGASSRLCYIPLKCKGDWGWICAVIPQQMFFFFSDLMTFILFTFFKCKSSNSMCSQMKCCIGESLLIELLFLAVLLHVFFFRHFRRLKCNKMPKSQYHVRLIFLSTFIISIYLIFLCWKAGVSLTASVSSQNIKASWDLCLNIFSIKPPFVDGYITLILDVPNSFKYSNIDHDTTVIKGSFWNEPRCFINK